MSAKGKSQARQKVAGRKAAERQRKRDLGMLPTEVWTHRNDVETLRAFVRDLNQSRGLG